MGDEQWPGLAGGSSGEVVPVDESDPIFDRIDPEPGPRDVEERTLRAGCGVEWLR